MVKRFSKSKKKISKIFKKNQLGKKKEILENYDNCFPGDSKFYLDFYFNYYQTNDNEKWLEFYNEDNKTTSFIAITKTSVDEILNDNSRINHKNYLISELNRIYKTQKKSNNDSCITKKKCIVYWIHSLCIFKNERGKGICQKKVIPEIIRFTRNDKKEVLLLADVIKNNKPSLYCFLNNGFNCTEEYYFNKDLDIDCNLLLKVINPKKNY